MNTTSLNALSSFEAAARHQSYTLAAAELHITHSAVSQQIRNLETSLGLALFVRRGRQMQLTEAGAALQQQIQPALTQIQRALSEIGKSQHAPAITVSTLPSFATSWLVPRLSKFQKLQPGVAVRIHASQEIRDLERSATDIAIRYGLGNWPGCDAEKFLEDRIFPVCSPNFNKGKLPNNINNLKRYRLLCDDCPLEWNTWSALAGLDSASFKHETYFSDSNLMLAAAIAGQGIAIGRSSLVSADIAAGRLVRLFDIIAPSDYAYYMVTASRKKKSPTVLAFEQWLRREAVLFEKRNKQNPQSIFAVTS
ncbi:transcriptional regulator GcvA [Undibacterium sp. Ren11W]|uniref:transcriptional regulator GcvA n=1 Tax=Undibacterium sp. Ren11W TaxID=3413045 RepID=UPI003BF31CF5